MARKSASAVQTFDDDPVLDPVHRPDPGSGPGRYRVSLDCPTPLAHASLEVEAATPEEARALFDQSNGISGSEHAYTVTKVA